MSKLLEQWQQAKILEAVFDHLSDAIVLYDSDMKISGMNRAAGETPANPKGKRYALPLLLGLFACVAVMGGGFLLWPKKTGQKQTSNGPNTKHNVTVEALPEPALPPPDLAMPTPPPPVPQETPKPPVHKPIHKPAVSTSKPVKVKEAVAPEQVDRKFQQVRAEYLEFKRNFGARLEAKWQEILSDIALGRRDQRVFDALDTLRQDMAAVRKQSATQNSTASKPN